MSAFKVVLAIALLVGVASALPFNQSPKFLEMTARRTPQDWASLVIKGLHEGYPIVKKETGEAKRQFHPKSRCSSFFLSFFLSLWFVLSPLLFASFVSFSDNFSCFHLSPQTMDVSLEPSPLMIRSTPSSTMVSSSMPLPSRARASPPPSVSLSVSEPTIGASMESRFVDSLSRSTPRA